MEIKGYVWLIAAVLFVIKLVADYYLARFKWIQAAQQREDRKQDASTETRIVNSLSDPVCWAIALIVTVIVLLSVWLAVKQDYQFPILTAYTLFSFAAISAIGALGDWRREASM